MKKQKVIYNQAQIHHSIYQQAYKLNNRLDEMDLKGKVSIIGILNGAFMFTSDLVKMINVPHKLDFMKITSYQGKFAASPKFTHWPKFSQGDHVVILDDMLDSGQTIIHAIEYIKTMSPASISVLTMLHREGINHKIDEYFQQNFVYADLGLPVKEDQWVYGYGLDNSELDRNLVNLYID